VNSTDKKKRSVDKPKVINIQFTSYPQKNGSYPQNIELY